MLGVAKKSERMETRIGQLVPEPVGGLPAAYEGFFLCFNRMEYYEAHDVLEHLWLQTNDPNAAFFKGLIQIAGAFVHLQKQYYRPHHHKYGKRLAPASRLFGLGLRNLEGFGKEHWQLDLEAVRAMCRKYQAALQGSEFQINPWRPATAPKLTLIRE